MNGVISNPVAGSAWLVAGAGVATWFARRRRRAWRRLAGEQGLKPSPEEASDIRARLVRDAFVGGGAWLALFVLLQWFF